MAFDRRCMLDGPLRQNEQLRPRGLPHQSPISLWPQISGTDPARKLRNRPLAKGRHWGERSADPKDAALCRICHCCPGGWVGLPCLLAGLQGLGQVFFLALLPTIVILYYIPIMRSCPSPTLRHHTHKPGRKEDSRAALSFPLVLTRLSAESRLKSSQQLKSSQAG